MGVWQSKPEAPDAASRQALDVEDWPWVWAIWNSDVLDWRNGQSDDQITARVSRMSSMTALPVEIQPYLFLGNAQCAAQVNRLGELGITHVLNVAGKSCRDPQDQYKLRGISYLEIRAEDEESYPMLERHLEECREFIRSARDQGGKCLVHCMAGINRSGVAALSAPLSPTHRANSS